MRHYHRLTAWVIVLIMMVCASSTCAETLTLPAELAVVEDAAFAGTAVTAVSIPEGTQTLGARAFADCTALNRVVIVGDQTVIGENCFDNCGAELLMVCPQNSKALSYARSHQLDYDADTVCRALIVYQTYADTWMATITGTGNDAKAMSTALSQQAERPFQVTKVMDATAEGILSSVASTFAGATDRDISLFYYTGHGAEDGSLVGYDGAGLLPSRLKAALDLIPGRKIVVIDACYSGQFLTDEESVTSYSLSEEQGAAAFTSAMMRAFSGGLISRAASQGKTWILVAAAANEESYEASIRNDGQSKVMGLFTYSLCRGLGWNGVTDSVTQKYADTNASGAISLAEAFSYACSYTAGITSRQHAQSNVGGCTWFAPFR